MLTYRGCVGATGHTRTSAVAPTQPLLPQMHLISQMSEQMEAEVVVNNVNLIMEYSSLAEKKKTLGI